MQRPDGYPDLSLYVDGAWLRDGGREQLEVINPATGAVIGLLPVATVEDIDLAVSSAQRAFLQWRDVTPLERAKVLQSIAMRIHNAALALACIITLEQGKCLRESLQEVHNTADTFEWMAEEGKRTYGRIVPARLSNVDQYVLHEPVGPVAAFSPWNFPAVLACRKVATALAAGCTIVIKPAEETPGIMLAIARICEEAGLPRGALNVLYGVPSQISERLIDSAAIKKISFTGSVPVGRELAIRAAKGLKKITLELGGHSPVIVMDDVDAQKVVALTLAAKFRNAGQLCLCPTRFFVHDRVHDAFASQLSDAASALRLGNGLDDQVQMGPLANHRRITAMQQFCADASDRGSRIHVGGEIPKDQSRGYFFKPTVISNLPADALVMTKEVFGPLALVTRFDDLSQALEQANNTEFGLASYGFTNSISAARQIERTLQAGNFSLNTYAVSAPEMPFSGIKNSGLGHEMGSEGLMEHMNIKAVVRAVWN